MSYLHSKQLGQFGGRNILADLSTQRGWTAVKPRDPVVQVTSEDYPGR